MNKIRILLVLITFSYSCTTFAQTKIDTFNTFAPIPFDVDSTLQSVVKNRNVPVLQVALISDNNISWIKTYGKETAEDVLFKIGSIEKVFTATALLQMHENGLINIDHDINVYLPFSVRNAKFPDIPITVKMLMAHRSGLEMFQYQFEWDTRELGEYKNQQHSNLKVLGLSEVEFFKASLDTLGINFNPDVWKFKPGKNFIYSNSGYLILHFLIEQVSGQTYSEYVTENIFKKIGMNHSVFADIDSTASFSNAYTRKGDEIIKLPFLSGMYTNAEDLAKLMIAQMNNGQFNNRLLLRPETIELMHNKHTHGKDLFHLRSNCQNFAGYGLGMIYYGNNIFGHGGSTIGYQGQWSFNKSDKSGYIILTNINSLLYRANNLNTVSDIDKLLKSELAYSKVSNKTYILLGVIGIGIIINILYFRRKKQVRRF